MTFLLKLFSPYQALLLFSTGVLSEIFLTPCSIHSIVPEAVCCDFIKCLLILSSSYSILFLFNRSAAQSCSSLFLFSNRVFSTSFISITFFLSFCSTFQGSLVSLVCQRSNLVLPLLFLFRFPSGAILDLGTRSSRSGGVL